MNIYINASNIYIGGGKVILDDLVSCAKYYENHNFVIYVDPRFKIKDFGRSNIMFKKIEKHVRFLVCFEIERKVKVNDIVIYLTNIPPIIKHKCTTVLVQSNRLVVDSFPLSGFSFKTKSRISIERLLFWINKRNADYIVVQSESMASILRNKGIIKNKIIELAYCELGYKYEDDNTTLNDFNLNDEFLYVGTGEPHKNHKNLVEAWCLLSAENIYPKLILTIDKNTDLYKYISRKIVKYGLKIDFKQNLERSEILNLYSRVKALIFPSFIESYGLPLAEAKHYKLPVIAPELDYVRDIVDPVETFDPNSAKSISRSVKRFLKINEEKTKIHTPSEFINRIIKL